MTLAERREAYQAENWEEYGRIADEMGQQKQATHEQVLRDVCNILGVSEDEFIQSHI